MKKILNFIKRKKRLFYRLLILLMTPCSAFAYDTGSDKLTDIITKAVDYAQAGPARAFCILAIACTGYLWIGKGLIPKSYALAVIGGAGFIFGAGYIGQVIGV